jgi:hypothetical protein
VLTHKDRLLRFGSELIFALCEIQNIEIVIINKGDPPTFEEELAQDVIEIVTVFSARLYGSRSHKTKRLLNERTDSKDDDASFKTWDAAIVKKTISPEDIPDEAVRGLLVSMANLRLQAELLWTTRRRKGGRGMLLAQKIALDPNRAQRLYFARGFGVARVPTTGRSASGSDNTRPARSRMMWHCGGN